MVLGVEGRGPEAASDHSRVKGKLASRKHDLALVTNLVQEDRFPAPRQRLLRRKSLHRICCPASKMCG